MGASNEGRWAVSERDHTNDHGGVRECERGCVGKGACRRGYVQDVHACADDKRVRVDANEGERGQGRMTNACGRG